jgi:thiamine biosynthesis lipoprotein
VEEHLNTSDAARPALLSQSTVAMGTVVTILSPTTDDTLFADAVARAFGWFGHVEQACSRFDPASELRWLQSQHGKRTKVSPVLFETLRLAVQVARATRGALDPTIGAAMERRGFNRHYVTGETTATTDVANGARTSYRDIHLDGRSRTVTLLQPLALDLGAVAKGMAIDLAARELQPLGSYSVEAGGDLYVAGQQAPGVDWQVGIQHPRNPQRLIETLGVSNVAVCTSGDYEKRAPVDVSQHHILDPRTQQSAQALASVTVIAPTASLADAISTAVFVLGAKRGVLLLARQGLDGLLITGTGERYATTGFQEHVSRHVLPSTDVSDRRLSDL